MYHSRKIEIAIARVHGTGQSSGCTQYLSKTNDAGFTARPTILKNRITSSNIKDLCEIEVLDLNKRVAKKPKEALVSV